jgi:hypothetical protein
MLSQTEIFSDIDSLIRTFKKLDYPYRLEILSYVGGLDENDCEFHYPIRKLTYKNYIVLEQMIREYSNGYDYIVSREFTIENEPKNWKIEVKETT